MKLRGKPKTQKYSFRGGLLCAALLGSISIFPASAQDQLFVSEDGPGLVGTYGVTVELNSAASTSINPSLISFNQTQQTDVTLCTDGNGDLFVAQWTTGANSAKIGEYSTSGAPINSSLITLPDSSATAPLIAADGQGHLFVGVGNTVSEYSSAGNLLNSFSVGVFATIVTMALDGQGHLFVTHNTEIQSGLGYNSSIGEYTTAGAVVHANLLSGIAQVTAITVGNGDIFLSQHAALPEIRAWVSEYTTAGATVNASLIQNLTGPEGLALDSQGDLFVADYGQGTVGAYTTSGAVLNSSLLTGLTAPVDLVAITTPEPNVIVLMLMGVPYIFGGARLRRAVTFFGVKD